MRGHDLQGHHLFKLAVRALCPVDRADAPAPQQFHGPIRTELSHGHGQFRGGRNLHGAAHFRIRFQQRRHFFQQFGVTLAAGLEPNRRSSPSATSAPRETRLRFDRLSPSESTSGSVWLCHYPESYQLILSEGWPFGKAPVQPGFREFQIAIDGRSGNIQKLGRFLIGATQEEAQLEHTHFPFLERLPADPEPHRVRAFHHWTHRSTLSLRARAPGRLNRNV